MKNKVERIPLIVIVGLVAAILAALVMSGIRDLTETESLFLGVFLAAASTLTSWLATKRYAQAASAESIKNYAVRAAEKVLNLSNELARLSEALSGASEDANDTNNYKESTALLHERINSAIHNLATLQSMNDTFLSDWRGVIGEEIDRQHNLEEEIGQQMKELRQQQSELATMQSELVSPEDILGFQQQIRSTEERITAAVSELPFKISTSPRRRPKLEAGIPCPECGETNSTMLRPERGARKLLQCAECEAFANIRSLGNGKFDIIPVGVLDFDYICPACATQSSQALADFMGVQRKGKCPHCGIPLKFSRCAQGANVRIDTGTRRTLNPEVVDLVLSKIPPRPWPQGFHKQIATDLNLSNSDVTKIITVLLRDGRLPPESTVERSQNAETGASLGTSQAAN